uniref:Uncharacterized protein n=1 Tax=Glossina brevipalpis TaxID=37001 RepID=A0A1A9WYI9_9MUSC
MGKSRQSCLEPYQIMSQSWLSLVSLAQSPMRALYNVGPLSNNIVTETTLNSVTSLSALPSTGLFSSLSINVLKLCSRPSLPLVIGVLALGGVACTLVGIVLGSTGLIGHSTQYLSAALLLIGIGVSLLVISGAIWRLSLPDDVNECRCYRRMEICRNCNSPFCDSRFMTGSYLYPEFQHRPPPPSYLTSVNECGGLSLLLQSNSLRINTPPPVYQSQISLSATTTTPSNTSLSNTINDTSTISTNIQTSTISETNHNNTTNGTTGTTDNCNTNVLQAIKENQNATTQAFKKEFNYLELD